MTLVILTPKAILRGLKAQAEASKETRLKEIELQDKMVALLATKDPMTFQQVQAMGHYALYDDFDPSEEGEMRRIHDREGGKDTTYEELSDAGNSIIDDIFPGSGFTGRS